MKKRDELRKNAEYIQEKYPNHHLSLTPKETIALLDDLDARDAEVAELRRELQEAKATIDATRDTRLAIKLFRAEKDRDEARAEGAANRKLLVMANTCLRTIANYTECIGLGLTHVDGNCQHCLADAASRHIDKQLAAKENK